MNEFFGLLTIVVDSDNIYTNGNLTKTVGKVKWIIRDDSKINQNAWEIEDNDFLEVYDNMGRVIFSKTIIKDYDSHYNPTWKKQIYNGTTVSWLPYGVDAGFWMSMFGNRFRSRLVKAEKQ